jgi:MOSC domain-containing protein YiiM
MTVSRIYIRCSPDERPREISEAQFIPDFGLRGDAKSGPGERQVCAITREGREAVNADPRNGLCFRRFHETLELDAAAEAGLEPGREFSIGEVRFKVSNAKKRCFPDCSIVQSGSICALPASVYYLKVLRGGKLRSGT